MSTKPPVQYRVTSLTSDYTCAFKAHNEEYIPNLLNTHHGDIMNSFANGKWTAMLAAHLRNYTENLNPDMKIAHTLAICGDKIQTYIKKLRDTYDEVLQEAQMFLNYWKDIQITWTPDIQYFNDEIDLYCCEDIKTSTHTWYSWDEMRDLNMQTYIYPLFMMNYYGVNEVWFRYVVADKNTGKIKTEPKSQKDSNNKAINSRENYVIRTRSECEAKLKEVMEDYVLPYVIFGELKARRNKLCNFCQFKDTICPLKKVFNVSSQDIDDDL